MGLPRPVRLNNPGDIRSDGTMWLGETPQPLDPEFVSFSEPVFGLRALMKILLNYQSEHKLSTVAQIVSRWAPPSENPTAAYIKDVASRVGASADAPLVLTDPATLILLAKAMVRNECGPCTVGVNWYSDDLYRQAAEMALGIDVAKVA